MVSRVLPSPAGKRVALVGDTPANAVWARRVIEELAAVGVDMVVQLGDFGWWPQKGFAEKVSHAAVIAGVTVCFIDGNPRGPRAPPVPCQSPQSRPRPG